MAPEMPNNPHAFSVMEGNFDAYRAVATIRLDLREYKDRSETPWFFGISTPLAQPTSEGLPNPKEAEELNRWEEIIEKQVGSETKFVFVGRVSWKGHRELLYYLDSPETAAQNIKQLIKAGNTRPFAFRYERDPDWANVKVYFSVEPNAKTYAWSTLIFLQEQIGDRLINRG